MVAHTCNLSIAEAEGHRVRETEGQGQKGRKAKRQRGRGGIALRPSIRPAWSNSKFRSASAT